MLTQWLTWGSCCGFLSAILFSKILALKFLHLVSLSYLPLFFCGVFHLSFSCSIRFCWASQHYCLVFLLLPVLCQKLGLMFEINLHPLPATYEGKGNIMLGGQNHTCCCWISLSMHITVAVGQTSPQSCFCSCFSFFQVSFLSFSCLQIAWCYGVRSEICMSLLSGLLLIVSCWLKSQVFRNSSWRRFLSNLTDTVATGFTWCTSSK